MSTPPPQSPLPPGPPNAPRYTSRRGQGPRRVRNGIKLRGSFDIEHVPARQPAAPLDPVAGRWLEYVRRALGPVELAAGLEYGRAGQTVSLDAGPALIQAIVQGRAPRPYHVRWPLPALSDAQWDRLIEAMAAEAGYAARLLVGEWPSALDELMTKLGISIVPSDDLPPRIECTCADQREPGRCKHAAVVGFLIAERLSERPLLIFTLLGRPEQWVIERLRQARAIQSRGVVSAHGDLMVEHTHDEALPLETLLDDFWHSPPHSRDLSELEHRAPPHHAPHALLRRMGPSPMNGRFPMVGLLASVYDTVSEAARQMRDRVDIEKESDVEKDRGSASDSTDA